MKKSLLLLSLLAMYGGEPARAAVSLRSAIEKSMARNPAIKAAASHVAVARTDFQEIRSLRYPRLSVRTQVMRSDNSVFVFGTLLEQQSFGAQNFAIDSLNHPDSITNIKNALDVGVPLFSAFEISSGEKIRRLMMERAQEEYTAADQEVRYRVVEAFLSVLQKQEKKRLLEERVRSAQNEVEDARRLNAKGLVLGSDFYAAQAILSSLQARTLQAEKEMEGATDLLAVLMGESVSTIEDLTGRLEHVRYTIDEKNDFVAAALASRKDLKGAQLQVSASTLIYNQSRRSVLPRVEAFASLETNTEDFGSNPNNHMYGVRSHVPLGDPSYFAHRSQAKSNIQMSQSQQAIIEDQIRMDVISALKRVQAAQASLPLVEKAVEQSQRSLELFRPLYKEGRQSILDVLKAEEGLATAQEGLNENRFQIHLGYASLHRSMGRFDSDVIDTIQSQLETAP